MLKILDINRMIPIITTRGEDKTFKVDGLVKTATGAGRDNCCFTYMYNTTICVLHCTF